MIENDIYKGGRCDKSYHLRECASFRFTRYVVFRTGSTNDCHFFYVLSHVRVCSDSDLRTSIYRAVTVPLFCQFGVGSFRVYKIGTSSSDNSGVPSGVDWPKFCPSSIFPRIKMNRVLLTIWGRKKEKRRKINRFTRLFFDQWPFVTAFSIFRCTSRATSARKSQRNHDHRNQTCNPPVAGPIHLSKVQRATFPWP